MSKEAPERFTLTVATVEGNVHQGHGIQPTSATTTENDGEIDATIPSMDSMCNDFFCRLWRGGAKRHDDWRAMAQTDEGRVSLCANTADANGTGRRLFVIIVFSQRGWRM